MHLMYIAWHGFWIFITAIIRVVQHVILVILLAVSKHTRKEQLYQHRH